MAIANLFATQIHNLLICFHLIGAPSEIELEPSLEPNRKPLSLSPSPDYHCIDTIELLLENLRSPEIRQAYAYARYLAKLNFQLGIRSIDADFKVSLSSH